MSLVSKQMEVRSFQQQLNDLTTDLETSQAVLALLNEKGSVTQQTETTKARVAKLKQEQTIANNKLQSVKNQSKELLESLQGLNLIAVHLEAVLRHTLGDKLKEREREIQPKLYVFSFTRDYK